MPAGEPADHVETQPSRARQLELGRISDPKLDNTIDAIKIATDPKARDALLKEALVSTRDQAYYVPLHHQMRPWAMKKNVSTVYKSDDRPESRFARVN